VIVVGEVPLCVVDVAVAVCEVLVMVTELVVPDVAECVVAVSEIVLCVVVDAMLHAQYAEHLLSHWPWQSKGSLHFVWHFHCDHGEPSTVSHTCV
jgi:hypothetical protein